MSTMLRHRSVAGVSKAVRLLGAGDIRHLAGRLGVHPTKKLGQNFVVEPGSVRQIAALAAVRPDDVILEVGPGLGSLTLALLETAPMRLVAVEIDPVLAGELPRTIAERAPDVADRVAVLHLLAALPSLRRGVVMVQAEVADRMCAGPGSRVYGIPSAKLAWYAEARPAGPGPRGVFWPVPNVDSKLGAFSRRDPPAAPPPPPAGGPRRARGGVRGDRRRLRPAPQAPARGPRRLGRSRGGSRAR